MTKIWNQRFPMSVRNASHTSDAMAAVNATFHTAYGRASTKSSQKKVRSKAARAETDFSCGGMSPKLTDVSWAMKDTAPAAMPDGTDSARTRLRKPGVWR